jgi:hypothetical protein
MIKKRVLDENTLFSFFGGRMDFHTLILISTLTINLLQIAKLIHDIGMFKEIRQGIKISTRNNKILCELCDNTVTLHNEDK